MNIFSKNLIFFSYSGYHLGIIFNFLPHYRRFSYIGIRIFKLRFNIGIGIMIGELPTMCKHYLWFRRNKIVYRESMKLLSKLPKHKFGEDIRVINVVTSKVDITPKIIWKINTIGRFHYLAGYYKGNRIACQSSYEKPGNIILTKRLEHKYTIEYDRFDNFRILK